MHSMHSQSIYSSKKDDNHSVFSNKKKVSNPALLFSKSGQKGQSSINNDKYSIKTIIQNENNPSLLNIRKSRSPMRIGSGRQNTKQGITSQKSSFIHDNERFPLNQINFPENNSFISCQSQRDNHQNQQSHFQLQNNDPLTRLTALSRISNIERQEESMMKQSIHFCQNHQTKVASHVSSINMSSVDYYCQKCAILLASQGYEVLKIGQAEHSDSFISDSSRVNNNNNSCRNNCLGPLNDESNEGRNSMMIADNSSFISSKSNRSSKQYANYNQKSQANRLSVHQSRNNHNNVNKSCGKSLSNTNHLTQQSISRSKNKLNYINNNSERQTEINNFLASTKQLSDNIMNKKQDIKESLIQSEQFYGEQIEEVNEYFDLVYQSLELEKNKCYNYILNQRKEVEEPIRMINETMNQLKDKIQSIISDIEENIETVFAAQNDVYKLVIGQYQENYAEIQDRISQVQIFPVQMRKIDFEGVPQSIYGLSDILKDSIQKNGQCQNKKKMHEQLNSLRDSLQESLPNIQPKKLFSSKQCSRQEYFDGGPSSVNTVCMSEKQKLYFSFQGDALRNQICEQVELEQDESKIQQRFYCENKNLQSFSD